MVRSCDRAIVHLLALSDASKTIHGMRAVENWHFLRKGEKREGGKRKGGEEGGGRRERRPRAFKCRAARSKWSSWGEWWRWEYRGPPGHVEAEKIMNINCRKKGTFILLLFTYIHVCM